MAKWVVVITTTGIISCMEHSKYIEYHKKYREEHREELARKQREYYARTIEERKKYGRKYTSEHKNEAKERMRRYQQTDKYKEYQRKYRQEHKKELYQKKVEREKKKYNYAHFKVSNALMRGELSKQPCEICGELEVEAHHDDYNKPLEVRWLCKKCHTEWHNKKNNQW